MTTENEQPQDTDGKLTTLQPVASSAGDYKRLSKDELTFIRNAINGGTDATLEEIQLLDHIESIETELAKTRQREAVLRDENQALYDDYEAAQHAIREVYHMITPLNVNVYEQLTDVRNSIKQIMYMVSTKLIEHQRQQAEQPGDIGAALDSLSDTLPKLQASVRKLGGIIESAKGK